MSSSSSRLLLFQLYLICQWIFLSSTIILFNKWIISTKKFHYPLTLVLLHMSFVSACAQLWRRAGWAEAPTISWRDTITRFAPIAALFAASLGFGNAAYLYISVAFVQMLKAATPVAVLLASFGFGLEEPSWRLVAYIVVIAIGVAVACYGQLQLNWTGVALQLAAVVVEALRLCLVNIALTSRGIKLSSVTFLSLVAPLCFLLLLPVRYVGFSNRSPCVQTQAPHEDTHTRTNTIADPLAPTRALAHATLACAHPPIACATRPRQAWAYFEAPYVCHRHFAPIRHVGLLTLTLNASVAFLLNLATMALIKNTSALTLNVSGVFKDIGLILWSVAVSGAVVTQLQYAGYAVAIVGVSAYSAYKRALQTAKEEEPAAPATPPFSKKQAYGDARPALAAEEAQPLASPGWSPAPEPSDT